MADISGDRRKATTTPDFPIVDSEGKEVKGERRSGKDRRKNKRGTDIAGRILNILN
jgi:hypothetical protein